MENRKKVLIVDDSVDSLDMLEMYLYQEYDIMTASNGLEGLNMALLNIPNVIVTDVMMSVMDGIGFYNKLQANKETKSIPVIAITAFTKQHSIKSLYSIGFRDVVGKPVSRKDIITSIKKIVAPKGNINEK